MTLRILPLPAPISPVQSIISGAQAGQRLRQNYFKNQMTQDQAKYLPQALNNAARMAQAKIQGLNINNQYDPGLLQGRTNLLNAQGAGQLVRNKLMPQTVGIAAQNANTKSLMANLSQTRTMPYAVVAMLRSPAGQALMQNSPQLATAFSNTLGNLIQNGVPPGGASKTGGIGNANSIHPLTFTQPQIQAAQNATGAALQKETSDEKTRQQALGGQQLLNEMGKINIKPLMDYSGVFGAAEQAGNRIKGALGLPLSKEAVAYNTFKQFTVPQMADQLRQALQTSVHPGYITAMIKPMTDPQSSIYDNPQEVLSRWNAYQNWLKNYTQQKTNAVTQGVPNSITGNASAATATSTSGFSPQKYLAGANSKAEALARFNKATPQQQTLIRRYLASQGAN